MKARNPPLYTHSNTLIEHKNEFYTTIKAPQYIPRIIHQTWKSRDTVPTQEHISMRLWQILNPEYTYIFYDDQDGLAFIENACPEWLHLYNQLPLPVQKADLFRYLIMYKKGGVYTDLDTTPTRPLRELIRSRDQCIIGLDRIQGREECLQWTLVSRPHHPVWAYVLQVVKERMELIPPMHVSRAPGQDRTKYTLWLTGPRAFTEGVSRFVKDMCQGDLWHDDSIVRGIHEAYPWSIEILDVGYLGGRQKNIRENEIFLMHHYLGSWKKQVNNPKKKLRYNSLGDDFKRALSLVARYNVEI